MLTLILGLALGGSFVHMVRHTDRQNVTDLGQVRRDVRELLTAVGHAHGEVDVRVLERLRYWVLE